MRVGVAADHGGYALKSRVAEALASEGHEVVDFGAFQLEPSDDYPDFVLPLAKALSEGSIERGIAICTSGVGASIAANKVAGVRAALICDTYSARQGVEDDDMNVICLGSRLSGCADAVDLIKTFLGARFSGAERHRRRLGKIAKVEEAKCQVE
ncbi:RpiB/LacA/LacB family sugar-phosphate isomerase [Geomonas sp. RF6]|uniref:RpiB/LacA/LacB family sugar-phosphate isomerase n=1 Tax=Geomonas sp. RF6 TaxID=2897342 RepID=UPI001E44C19C|nr:RpiB/LacA/LacB family sugar-phosphate isomerase [Geomonas sp. RF6]UFS69938.1 RpiB/LacA/LacB family sugar-phosphate isomerase [Geomonas sp. RF6]